MLREYLELHNLKRNIDFIQQHKVNKYFIDFYIPHLNLGIEVDGEQWHTDLKREEEREEILKKKLVL